MWLSLVFRPTRTNSDLLNEGRMLETHSLLITTASEWAYSSLTSKILFSKTASPDITEPDDDDDVRDWVVVL